MLFVGGVGAGGVVGDAVGRCWTIGIVSGIPVNEISVEDMCASLAGLK